MNQYLLHMLGEPISTEGPIHKLPYTVTFPCVTCADQLDIIIVQCIEMILQLFAIYTKPSKEVVHFWYDPVPSEPITRWLVS